jgi:hypothetical protein
MVAAGGTVIANSVNVGIYDEHLQKRALPFEAALSGHLPGYILTGNVPATYAALKAASHRTNEGEMIKNEDGTQSIPLTDAMFDELKNIRTQFRALLAIKTRTGFGKDILPFADLGAIERSAGKAVISPSTKVTVFQNGPAQMIAVNTIGYTGKTLATQLKVNKTGFLYDSLVERFPIEIKSTTQVNSVITTAGNGSLWTVLPYQVGTPTLKILTTPARGSLLKVTVELPLGSSTRSWAKHPILFKLIPPNGRRSQAIKSVAETAAYSSTGPAVPTAQGEIGVTLNQPAGVWTLEATDVLTRKTASTSVTLP